MAIEQIIVHVSYADYASTIIEHLSSCVDHICTYFPEDIVRYPDGTLQLKSSAKWFYSTKILDPIRNSLINKAKQKYPIKPGRMWTTAQLGRMSKENFFEHRDISYMGIKQFTDHKYKLFYHGEWTRQHLMSFPQNDVAFNGELPYGCITVTVLFKNIVKPAVRQAYEAMLAEWITSMHDEAIFGPGAVSFCNHASEINPLVAELFKGRSAQVCLNIFNASQIAINWLIVNLIHFCKKAVIDQIQIQGITHPNPVTYNRGNVWWH